MSSIGFKLLRYYIYDRIRWKKRIKSDQSLPAYAQLTDSLQSYQESSSRYFTVFDLETTGFYPALGDEVISIGAVKIDLVEGCILEESFYRIVRPIHKVPRFVRQLTGLSIGEIRAGWSFIEALDDFLTFSRGTTLIAHPVKFDVYFLQTLSQKWDLPDYLPPYLDSEALAKEIFPKSNPQLDSLIRKLNIERHERHHALNDARMTAELCLKLFDKLDLKDNYEQEIRERIARDNLVFGRK
ncbi:3'-5' exoribonuclease [Bacillus sp. NTK071]|uniref:3'-5' exonuclease n=1 Tax=Bacillus sp. NTK071 TaxID=2802175 RepID=UPI001A8D098C|nr:exonuclease domain-containing protein [Bacillus sp. NTK071]MBN8207869.1 3'-5' exoribonuclease [Bacillus sp. NTK071]